MTETSLNSGFYQDYSNGDPMCKKKKVHFWLAFK